MLIAGVDEVGRGALAGPVVTAAVIWPHDTPWPVGLRDSKRLSAVARVRLDREIRHGAIAFALGRAEAHEVDALNVLRASLLAMARAVAALATRPDEVWVDGRDAPCCPCPVKAFIAGDANLPVISAASIIAKVARDAEMDELDARYPGYGFRAHKGYPTEQHRAALIEHGASEIHRRAYAPVKAILTGTA